MGEVHRGDVPGLEEPQRCREFGPESSEELATSCGRSVRGASAADEDDAGGKGVRADGDGSSAPFRSHRPSASDAKPGLDDCLEESLPSRTGGSRRIFGLRLLEGVIDRRGEGRVRLSCQSSKGLGHAVQKEALGGPAATVPIGRRD